MLIILVLSVAKTCLTIVPMIPQVAYYLVEHSQEQSRHSVGYFSGTPSSSASSEVSLWRWFYMSIKSRILRLEILRDLVDLELDGSTCRVKRQGTLPENPTCFDALAE